ncbi:DUF3397 domain-containing protein [Aliibacillus thermotolerans]|uniref:DUF3397 domain-containing protein n=1 Tax=Aliibacillus thermotolerans TaxID=1834418 RepID=A0ABW0U3R4_9BACI|nr:DUF3397 domain-containing protein [Aliibacillus thermotolerans]MDA3131014.1 DUF3397 family protein [Aliibacillus thermotolerans]
MGDILAGVVATIITVPILAWYLVYIVTVKWTKRKGKAIRLAADVSTILFIAAVHFLIIAIWGESLFWVLLVIILLAGVGCTIIHYKNKHDVEFFRLLRGIWRFNFILFGIGYVILSVCGIVLFLLSTFVT